jgi:uncharacterized protein
MADAQPLLTARARILGYGRGVFRTGGIEHRGSLLIMPGGVYAWPVANFSEVTAESLAAVLNDASAVSFLLLGTGAAQHFATPALRTAFSARNIGLDAMDTGAACRTYNVLLDEGRAFAAALIALD